MVVDDCINLFWRINCINLKGKWKIFKWENFLFLAGNCATGENRHDTCPGSCCSRGYHWTSLQPCGDLSRRRDLRQGHLPRRNALVGRRSSSLLEKQGSLFFSSFFYLSLKEKSLWSAQRKLNLVSSLPKSIFKQNPQKSNNCVKEWRIK